MLRCNRRTAESVYKLQGMCLLDSQYKIENLYVLNSKPFIDYDRETCLICDSLETKEEITQTSMPDKVVTRLVIAFT